MNKLAVLVVVILFSGCSKFNEQEIELPTEIVSNLPYINITADMTEFNGMMDQPTIDIEIDGRFSLTRNNELIIDNEEIELELKGSYSLQFPLKSLGVKFEDKYDNRDRSLINPTTILPHHNLDKIKAIRLRNSGNDFEKTMLKDLSMTQLAINAGLDIDLTYGEPVLIYVNNEFYGLMNLRTEANTNGMAGLNAVNKSKITLAKITNGEMEKKDGDFDRLDALEDAIDAEDIDYLKSEIDINSFIDYLIFQSYVGNADWPHNNTRLYAVNDEQFRFVLFDLDNATLLQIGRAPVKLIENIWNPNLVSAIFTLFYDDENDDSFKMEFLERYQEVLESGHLSTDKLKLIVDENSERIEVEMQHQIDKYNAPRTILEWEIELDKILSLFREREAVVNAEMN